MRFRVGRKTRACTKTGDTLVEVMFAIGIFSLVAIAVTSLMMSGSSNMQTALEATMARNEIDAQAEALRFIHQAYIAEKNEGVAGTYTEAWNTIKALADENTASLGINSSDLTALSNKNIGLFVYKPLQCDDIYAANYAGGSKNALDLQHAFVVDTRNIAKDNFIQRKEDDASSTVFIPASVYPRLYYTNSLGVDNTSLMYNGRSLHTVEGLYVIGVHDINSTILTTDNNGTDATVKTSTGNSAFYDFYIRSCWYGYGKSTPTTISTLIRLYDPDVTVADNKSMDYVVTYDWNGHDCTNTTTGVREKCPVYQEKKPIKLNQDGHFTLGNKLPDGYTAGVDLPLGWSTDKNAHCGSTDVRHTNVPSETNITVTPDEPFVTFYAVWTCKYVVSYNTNTVLNPSAANYSGFSNPAQYPDDIVVDAVPDANGVYRMQLKHLGSDAPTYTNARFDGWKCSGTNCRDTETHNGAYTIVFTGSKESEMKMVFKAQWTPFNYSYRLHYDLMGGSGSFPDQEATVKDQTYTFTVSNNAPSKPGYIFKGWSANSSANTIDYRGTSGSSSITLTNNTVFSTKTANIYAVWERENLHDDRYVCSYTYEVEYRPGRTRIVTVNYGTPVEDFTRGATSGGTICLVGKSVDYVPIDSSIEPSICIYDEQYVTLYNTRTYDSRELHMNAGTGSPRLYYDIWESKYDDPQETWGEIECPNGASTCIDGVSLYGYYKNIDQGRCTNPSGCGGGGWIPRGEMWYKSYFYQCDVMVSSGGMKGYRSGHLDLESNSNIRRVDYCRSGYNEYDSNRCYMQAVIPPEN